MLAAVLIALPLVLVPNASGATDEATTALQKGLFEEEANHDLTAAIRAYQGVIKQFDRDRKLAATAVFRLGECYRKQGQTNDANAQYERIIRDFSDQSALVTLSRSYLAVSGHAAVSETSGPASATSEEADEVRRIQAMIKDSPDLINARDGAGRAPLHRAAQNSQLVVATFLLDNGADVNAKDSNGRTPLIMATDGGYKEMMELLLSHGADVQATQSDPSAPTALDVAALKGFRSLVELLLAHGAKVNAAVANGVSPLHLAAMKGYKSVAEVLIQHGADVNALASEVRSMSGTPLHIAAQLGNQTMAELLLANKADPNLKTANGSTPLHVAAAFGQDQIAKLLLDHGGDVNARNASGETPLALAVVSQRVAVAKVLIDAKADPNLTFNINGTTPRTPLYAAVSEKNMHLVSLLLDHGANPNIEDPSDQNTALLQAARMQLKEIASLLIKAKADPNTHDLYGQTPLHFAVAEPATLELLLDGKAQVNATDNFGETPLHWAAGAGLKPAADPLISHGADVNALDRAGNTPLHFAVAARRTELTDLLLSKGADPNIPNQNGQTPLNWVKNAPGGSWVQFGNNYSFVRPSIPGTLPPPRFTLPGSPATPSSRQSSEELTAALKSHGAVDEIPHLDRIEVSRSEANYSAPIFYKGTNDWNQFTALELVGVAYDLLDSNPYVGSAVTVNKSHWAGSQKLAFPDLAKVRIRQPAGDLKTWRERRVDLSPVLQSGDRSKDVNLAWGEVVEIPEADHPLSQQWQGFTDEELFNLTNCLSREVRVMIKGHSTKLVLGPKLTCFGGSATSVAQITKASFWLKPALRQSNLLLASSDLSRVKVTRSDKATGQKREWVLDCSDPKPAPAFWLRDGDVIEVPEKN